MEMILITILLQKKLKSRFLINQTKIKSFFENAKKIVCVSRYTKEKLLDVIPFKVNSEVIHHGIELKNVEPIKKRAFTLEKSIRHNENIDQNKIILAYVSRLEPMKGQETLINVLSKNNDLIKKTHTIFIGGGSQDDYLKS